MKSAPPHNNVSNHINSYWTPWAWWRQMFGPGMGEHHTNRLSLYLWEKRDIYKRNAGCNWFREFNHFTDLLYMRSETVISPVCCIQILVELDFRGAACAFERGAKHKKPHERLKPLSPIHLVQDMVQCTRTTWGQDLPIPAYQSSWISLNHTPICWAWMGDRWADRWQIANGQASLGGAPASNGPFMLPVKWGLCDTHTHTHLLLKMSWHLALQQVRR